MINRRESLKLASLLLSPTLSKRPFTRRRYASGENKKNILIIVFDAFSAKDIPFYGFPRNTTPNLNKLLDHAVVYHNHYASGNFTSPGTASLLTGLYPWKHRVFNLRAPINEEFRHHNIFELLDGHFSLAYSQNLMADSLFQQFRSSIDEHLFPESLYIYSDLPGLLFKGDSDIAKLSAREIYQENRKFANSLFIKDIFNSDLIQQWLAAQEDRVIGNYKDSFPRGIPASWGDYFTIEHALDWLQNRLLDLPRPFITYFHLLPPHAKYKTRKDFIDVFAEDNYQDVKKPTHLFATDYSNSVERYAKSRREYDEFILYVDSEFNRLYQYLEENNILDDTVVIFTSDHGEIFERGFSTHSGESLYEPLVKIPLVIFDPDISGRVDVHQTTSAVDLLPTLLTINELPIPESAEGLILPPYNLQPHTQDVFALQAEGNMPNQRVRAATAMVIKEEYKLVYYYGYPKLDGSSELFELYNVQDDPQELENLYSPTNTVFKQLRDALFEKLEQA